MDLPAGVVPVVAAHAGRKFGFERTATDHRALLADPQINTLLVFTRHHVHASLVIQGIEAGKHVFVEKPLCLTLKELERVRAALRRSPLGR